MATREQTYTNEAFWEFVELPENADKNFELIYGVLVEVPFFYVLHGIVAANILYLIMAASEENQLGYTVGSSLNFVLAEGLIFKPDAAFISKNRLVGIPDKVELSPDLAVEIMTPWKNAAELLQKAETYLRYGTQQVWVVYPGERTVYVYTAGEAGRLNLRKYTDADTLTAEDILPDLSAPVAKIFP